MHIHNQTIRMYLCSVIYALRDDSAGSMVPTQFEAKWINYYVSAAEFKGTTNKVAILK